MGYVVGYKVSAVQDNQVLRSAGQHTVPVVKSTVLVVGTIRRKNNGTLPPNYYTSPRRGRGITYENPGQILTF